MDRLRFATIASALTLAVSGTLTAAVETAWADSAYDDITMQKQEKTQWCWVASGLTIAQYQGYGSTQTDFCNRAAKHNANLSCDNQPATLGDMASAWGDLGMPHTGTGLSRAASFAEVRTDVDAARPLGARIGWKSGGGHMNVVYGYDTSNNTIGVGDPWPDTATYTWWNYNDYVNNSSFSWTHSRTGISS